MRSVTAAIRTEVLACTTALPTSRLIKSVSSPVRIPISRAFHVETFVRNKCRVLSKRAHNRDEAGARDELTTSIPTVVGDDIAESAEPGSIKRRGRGRPKKSKAPDVAIVPTRPRSDEPESLAAQEAVSSSTSDTLTSTLDEQAPSVPRRLRRLKNDISKATHSLVKSSSAHHSDLASFLAHAAATGLNPKTNVYTGTHYEYTVAAALARYNFSLTRVGRSSDLGIDLIGHWDLPPSPASTSTPLRTHHTPSPMDEPSSKSDAGRKTKRKRDSSRTNPSPRTALRVLIQCKSDAPKPAQIRELEGSAFSASSAVPHGWRPLDPTTGHGVLALLVAAEPATRGIRDAVARSRWPLGFVNVSREGVVRQFVWNRGAEEGGLQGVGVGLRYRVLGGDREVGDRAQDGRLGAVGVEGQVPRRGRAKLEQEIAFMWDGVPWPA